MNYSFPITVIYRDVATSYRTVREALYKIWSEVDIEEMNINHLVFYDSSKGRNLDVFHETAMIFSDSGTNIPDHCIYHNNRVCEVRKCEKRFFVALDNNVSGKTSVSLYTIESALSWAMHGLKNCSDTTLLDCEFGAPVNIQFTVANSLFYGSFGEGK